jgi:hypothetical protein
VVMNPAEQSTMCVSSFLWDARVDLGNAIRDLDATVNRLGDEALADTMAPADAARVKALADDLVTIRAEVTAMYSRWNHHLPAEFKAAS